MFNLVQTQGGQLVSSGARKTVSEAIALYYERYQHLVYMQVIDGENKVLATLGSPIN